MAVAALTSRWALLRRVRNIHGRVGLGVGVPVGSRVTSLLALPDLEAPRMPAGSPSEGATLDARPQASC